MHQAFQLLFSFIRRSDCQRTTRSGKPILDVFLFEFTDLCTRSACQPVHLPWPSHLVSAQAKAGLASGLLLLSATRPHGSAAPPDVQRDTPKWGTCMPIANAELQWGSRWLREARVRMHYYSVLPGGTKASRMIGQDLGTPCADAKRRAFL